MNGFSHHYQLDESTVIFRGVRSDIYFLSHFSMKFLQANRIAQIGRGILRRHIWGYSVCLCPIKGTLGLNESILLRFFLHLKVTDSLAVSNTILLKLLTASSVQLNSCTSNEAIYSDNLLIELLLLID